MRDALKSLWERIATPENIWAFVLFLIAVASIISTTDASPAWVYQGL